MAVNWTPEQLQAIESRGGTRLVSAAAGSGKTAVLVERVIRRILDDSDPCDIDSFLIVTFTKAAAAEMKAKIADALTAKLLEQPENRRLRRQLTLLDRAQITTVHSFCSSLLRENFQAAGLTPDFRVADEDEIALLREELLDELIEERYEMPDNEGFLMLVESLSAMRDDSRLRNVMLETYRKLQSHSYPEKWLAEMADRPIPQDPMDSTYGRILLDSIADRCRHAAEQLADARALMNGFPAVEKYYGAVFSADLAAIRQLITLLEERRWDEAAAFGRGIGFARLPGIRKFDDPVLLDLLKAPRDAWKKTLAGLCRDYFGFTAAQFLDDMRAAAPYGAALFSLVADFMARLDGEKRMRNILDFGDLEHLTVRMLLGDDGAAPTPLARALSARYTEIMVDEYQDTNDVQDAIFRALSRNETNLFMVGDIKQSIYRFRLANPEVFLRKYLTYLDEPAPGEPGRIVLAKNFRSRVGITEAVNIVFENIMSTKLGDVDYGDRERLEPGADYPPDEGSPAELCLVETQDEDELKSIDADAAYVSARIRQMLDEGFPIYDREADAMRPCAPEDFVILLRSVKGRSAVYEAALRRAGIAVLQDVGTELFDSPDVMVLMSLIDVLDNPEQDVPLVSLMRSPLFRFSADELAQIRIASPDTNFYDAVYTCAGSMEDTLGERCRALLDTLEDLRLAAEELPADRLILRILNETKLETVCSRLTEGRGQLQAVLAQAQRFEKAGYCGLYRFARMMRALRDRGCEVPPAPDTASAVRIMSIHKSKGLEFPIVILAGCMQRFNTNDLTDPVLIHESLGPGFRRRQLDRRIEYPTLPRLAIAIQAKREMLSEEERILYVAMTRAKEKLIVTAPVKRAADLAARYYPDIRRVPLSHQMLENSTSYLPWILTPLLRLPCAAPLFSEAGIAAAFDEEGNHGWTIRAVRPGIAADAVPDQAPPETETLPLSREALLTRFAFRYPHEAAKDLPSKMTATSLKGRFTDAEAAEEAAEAPELRETRPERPAAEEPGSGSIRRPRFIQDRGLTGAERGTALHLAMQFIDFSACTTPEGVRREIDRLQAQRFLTPEQASAADPMRILRFFFSPLGRRMAASDGIRREFKFSLLASADTGSDLSALRRIPGPEEDTILFQGVIDCCFEEAGKLILIDFKTDYCLPGRESVPARRYVPQLTAYALALERITGKPVAERHLYFFQTGADIPV